MTVVHKTEKKKRKKKKKKKTLKKFKFLRGQIVYEFLKTAFSENWLQILKTAQMSS